MLSLGPPQTTLRPFILARASSWMAFYDCASRSASIRDTKLSFDTHFVCIAKVHALFRLLHTFGLLISRRHFDVRPSDAVLPNHQPTVAAGGQPS